MSKIDIKKLQRIVRKVEDEWLIVKYLLDLYVPDLTSGSEMEHRLQELMQAIDFLELEEPEANT